jgi:hypothetical protein
LHVRRNINGCTSFLWRSVCHRHSLECTRQAAAVEAAKYNGSVRIQTQHEVPCHTCVYIYIEIIVAHLASGPLEGGGCMVPRASSSTKVQGDMRKYRQAPSPDLHHGYGHRFLMTRAMSESTERYAKVSAGIIS